MNDCSNCTADLCVVRNRKLPQSMLTTCRSGDAATVDRLLEIIETGRANRREARKEIPFTKAANLRFAPPSRPSMVGTLIRSALEDAGHQGTLTGTCRNYLRSLNMPQRHDAESITDRLCEELQFESVQNVRRAKQGPKSRETIDAIVRQAMKDDVAANVKSVNQIPPDVSTIGTRLIDAIEAAAGYRINCGACKTYLRSLNKTLAPDGVETIVERILPGIGLPVKIRDEVGGTKEQRVWLRAVVERVIANP